MSQTLCGTDRERATARREIGSFSQRQSPATLLKRDRKERTPDQAGWRFPFFWISSEPSNGALFRNHVATSQTAAATIPATNSQL